MTVVTPHELLMALEEEAFPWESRILTDFNQVLPKIKAINSQINREEVLAQAKLQLSDES